MSAATLNSGHWDARTLAGWSEPHLANVESALSRWVGVDAPVLLGDAMRYAVLDGGKRLRPLLVLAASEAVGGNKAAALRAACATELIHVGQAVMAFGGTVDYLVETVFNYPTLAESYKVAALDAQNKLQHLSRVTA